MTSNNDARTKREKIFNCRRYSNEAKSADLVIYDDVKVQTTFAFLVYIHIFALQELMNLTKK